MAKAIKIKIVPEIKVAPEKITPEKVDISEFRVFLEKLKTFAENPKTVTDRQELAVELEGIIIRVEYQI